MASLTSSVLDYRQENGRRYHPSAMEVISGILTDRPKSVTDCYHSLAYLLPNDETENECLDMLHEIFHMLLNRKLYLGPIKKPQ